MAGGATSLTARYKGFRLTPIHVPRRRRPGSTRTVEVDRRNIPMSTTVAQLEVVAGSDAGKVFPLGNGQTFVIGRGQATDTRLSDLQVSRVHCRVEADGGNFRVVDNDSASGTLVNGVKVTKADLRP